MGDRHDEHALAASGGCGFVDVGPVERVGPGSTLRAAVGDAEVTVVNAGGRLFAVGDLCLRCGASLSDARVGDGQLTCGGCGWQYELEGGFVVGLPALHTAMHEVRVADGHIFVGVPTLPVPASY